MILFGGINLLIVDFSGEHFKEMSALTFRKLLSLFTGTPFRHKVLPSTHPAQPLPQICMTRIELKWQCMTNDQDWCFSPSASLIPRGYENTQMEAYFICFEKYWGTGKQRCNSWKELVGRMWAEDQLGPERRKRSGVGWYLTGNRVKKGGCLAEKTRVFAVHSRMSQEAGKHKWKKPTLFILQDCEHRRPVEKL